MLFYAPKRSGVERGTRRPRLRGRDCGQQRTRCQHHATASWPACLTRNKFPNRNIMYSVALAAFLMLHTMREASAIPPPPLPPPPKPTDRVKRSENMTCAAASTASAESELEFFMQISGWISYLTDATRMQRRLGYDIEQRFPFQIDSQSHSNPYCSDLRPCDVTAVNTKASVFSSK